MKKAEIYIFCWYHISSSLSLFHFLFLSIYGVVHIFNFLPPGPQVKGIDEDCQAVDHQGEGEEDRGEDEGSLVRSEVAQLYATGRSQGAAHS
jgi:hypothetical protein